MDANYSTDESSEDEDTCWKRNRIENALIEIETQLIKLKYQKKELEKALKKLDKK